MYEYRFTLSNGRKVYIVGNTTAEARTNFDAAARTMPFLAGTSVVSVKRARTLGIH